MVPLNDPVQINSTLVILTVLLQITALLIVALVVSYRYKHNAAIRYGVGYSTLVGVVVLSVLSLFIQFNNSSVVSIPLLSEQWLQQSDFSEPFVQTAVTVPSSQSLQSINLVSNFQSGALSNPVSLQSNPLVQVFGLIPKYMCFGVLWLGGVALLIIRLVLGFHNMDKMRKKSRCLERNDQEHIACLFGRDKIEEFSVQFRESPEIKSPLVVGIFKPVVLLPTRFLWKLNNSQLQAILLHELAHIERQDTKANLLQKLIVALFWFHPLIHLLDRQISRAREELCDNCVLEQQSALEYGEALFHASLATTEVPGKVSYLTGAMGIFNGDWKLEQRIKELIDIERERGTSLQVEDKLGILLSIGLITLILSFSKVSTAQISASKTTDAVPVNYSSFDNRENIKPIRINYIPSIEPGDRFITSVPGQQLFEPGSDALDPIVLRIILQVRELISSGQDESDFNEAKVLLDKLYEQRFDMMNDFEKSTTLISYANYYERTANYPLAIRTIDQILALEDLTVGIRGRALRALGQLNHAEGNHQQAISYFTQWRELTWDENERVLRELASSYAALGNYESAYDALIDLQELKKTQF